MKADRNEPTCDKASGAGLTVVVQRGTGGDDSLASVAHVVTVWLLMAFIVDGP